MDLERITRPPTAVRSRASTIVLDEVERGTPAREHQQPTMTPQSTTPQASELDGGPVHTEARVQSVISEDVREFKPFQLLMETEITIEHGKRLKARRVIHEELLCCYSQSAQKLFLQAKDQREANSIANDMRRQLKRFVIPNMSSLTFEENHMETKVIIQLVRIYEKYPLVEYRKAIVELLDDSILEQVAKRNVIAPQSKTTLAKKDLKDMGIQPRLQGVNSKAVFVITQHLSAKLREIKHTELEAAKTNRVKAAAQRRIMLPEVDERVVRSLANWLYGQGAPNCEDAEHLYALHAVAIKLGVTQLAEQCLSILASETEGIVQFALSQGGTLQQILGLDSSSNEETDETTVPARNVVQVVFHHVLKDKQPPKRLIKLVVDVLAEHLDVALWAELRSLITQTMSLRLIDSIVARRQVKTEEAGRSSVKSESVSTGNEDAMFASGELIHH